MMKKCKSCSANIQSVDYTDGKYVCVVSVYPAGKQLTLAMESPSRYDLETVGDCSINGRSIDAGKAKITELCGGCSGCEDWEQEEVAWKFWNAIWDTALGSDNYWDGIGTSFYLPFWERPENKEEV